MTRLVQPANTIAFNRYDTERKVPYACVHGTDENGRYEQRYYDGFYPYVDEYSDTIVPFRVERDLIDKSAYALGTFEPIPPYREASARWRIGTIWRMGDYHVQIVGFDPYNEDIAVVIWVEASLDEMIAKALEE